MSKTISEIKPNYAPVYAAALYPELAKIFQKHGYALAVHGSLARDFDLIAVPWMEALANPEDVVGEIIKTFVITIIDKPMEKNWGRLVYTLSVGFGECAIDLSFFPKI